MNSTAGMDQLKKKAPTLIPFKVRITNSFKMKLTRKWNGIECKMNWPYQMNCDTFSKYSQ